MKDIQKKLLKHLKKELKFVEEGGYRRPSWHPPLIFEDSPACPKYRDPGNLEVCLECPLRALVREDLREEKIPCRHIPLNERGETLDSLYRSSTQAEIETILANWLKAKIYELEASPVAR
ncbi:MAG TPA: hypothetical protein VMB47_18380 [Candidatus Aquilonibacter sp.]|nr:hypothetical protein [Candidatus Aquilonibacter sp.]